MEVKIMYKIQFSVVSYFPSVITNENINVGILFHNLNTDERSFHIMKNWNRLESFDDELDVGFMKKYLFGMKAEAENSFFNNGQEFSMKEFIKYYVNEIKFCDIREVDVENVDEFIINTEKVYMRLDFEKSERLSKDRELKYIKLLMKSNKVQYSLKAIPGLFDENVHYDYIVGNYGFKNFMFEDKKISRQIMNAKAWSYTANTLKGKYNTVFVYDVEKDESSSYRIIMKILKENAYKIISNSDVLDFVIQIQKEEDLKYQRELEFR